MRELAVGLQGALPTAGDGEAQIALTLPAAATRYAAKFGLEDLHGEICEMLPADDKPGDCHASLMSLPWRSVYTTGFDLLVERSSPADSVDIAYDRKLSEFASSARKLVIKLCGDRAHKTLMRATPDRLTASSLDRECPRIFEHVVFHLQNAPFLLLGYEPGDPFLEFVLELAGIADRRRASSDPAPVRYAILRGGSTAQIDSLRMRHSIHSVRLPEEPSGFRAELQRLLQRAKTDGEDKRPTSGETHQKKPPRGPRRPRGQPTTDVAGQPPLSNAFSALLSRGGELPVFATPGKATARIYESAVLPVCAKFGQKASVMYDDAIAATPEGEETAATRMMGAEAAVFAYSQPSAPLELLVERAIRMRSRAIVLCEKPSDLGAVSELLRYQLFSHPALADYLTAQVRLVLVDHRLLRSEYLLKQNQPDLATLTAWIACETALREQGMKSVRAYLTATGDLAAEESWKLRNRVAHEGYLPTKKEGETALQVARAIVRSVSGLSLPKFLEDMTITREGTSKDPSRDG
ncbi:MAG: hypothetical protein PHV11_04460 [Candidatus Bipolaricaulis sp.]|nr:hypothetical protein [Candidatus Bipolaricaulis sp.]